MIDYGSVNYLIIKSIHIIFMVSYFAGLFYLLRLFVYFSEATDSADQVTLQNQFRIMIKRLWNIIIVPAGIIMLISGAFMLSATQGYLLKQPWMHIKLTLLLLFLGFHLFTWSESKKIVNNKAVKFSALQFRKINEIPTLFLMAIVFVVILKQNIFQVYPKLIIGFIVIAVLIFLIIKIVNRKK